ncbi:hypothetical protein V6N11_007138 [Hibiscus sabdariffa]|uniref:Biogenesis of lysosome-related organelles complex 1 subunit 2 n=1 Tax=Hibiscus sabdariffa TaxID=183260 RepID=A0ABR2RST6_9ROSI
MADKEPEVPDELAESLNDFFISLSSMVKSELQGTNNVLELLEKMNVRVADEYKGFGDVASGLRVFVEQLKKKSGNFDAYVQQIDAIEQQVTEFEAVISVLDRYGKEKDEDGLPSHAWWLPEKERNDDLCHILHESCCLADAPAIIEVYWQWLFMAWWSDAMDRHSLGLFPGSLGSRCDSLCHSALEEESYVVNGDSTIGVDVRNCGYWFVGLVFPSKSAFSWLCGENVSSISHASRKIIFLSSVLFDKLEIWVRVFNIPVGSWERYLVIRSDVRLPSTLEEVVVISKFEWN